MYQRILVPVDLAHLESLSKALDTAADLANQYNADLCYVGVTGTAPSNIAPSPEAFSKKLEAFAKQQQAKHGRPSQARSYQASDPVASVDDLVLKAVDECHCDLLVMATHDPKKLDAILPSNGSKIAKHTQSSVFLVRG